MRRPRRRLPPPLALLPAVFPVVLPAVLGACAAPNTPEACRIERVAELPIRMVGNMPLVQVEVGGKPARLMLDTGADVTLLSQDAFARLGLEHDYTTTSYATGLGARTMNWPTKPVPLRLGALETRPAPLPVAPIAWPPRLRNPPDGLLGGRTLASYDLDVDMPRGRLTLYRPRNCPDGPPPFEGAAMTLRATGLGAYKLAVPVAVDGREVQAEVDTGAGFTLLDAQRVGLTEADMAADRASRVATVDPVGMAVRLHRFAQLQVGGETLANPTLAVGAIGAPGIEALLGSDYWRTRRLWLSYAGRTVTVGAPQPAPPRRVEAVPAQAVPQPAPQAAPQTAPAQPLPARPAPP